MGETITGLVIWAVLLGPLALIGRSIWRRMSQGSPRATALLIALVVTHVYIGGALLLALTIWPPHH